MAFDPQKKEALQSQRMQAKEENRQRILAKREEKNKGEARTTLRKYGAGENLGTARREIDNFRNNPEASESAQKQAEKYKGLQKNMPIKNLRRGRRENLKIMTEASSSVFAIFHANLISDWPYAIALFFAVLKDIVDLMEVTGIGYILVLIFTFMCSILIAMMMILGGTHGARKQRKIIRSWIVLLSGTTTEMIFGIDLLPIETITVIVIYYLFLVDNYQARKGALQQAG